MAKHLKLKVEFGMKFKLFFWPTVRHSSCPMIQLRPSKSSLVSDSSWKGTLKSKRYGGTFDILCNYFKDMKMLKIIGLWELYLHYASKHSLKPRHQINFESNLQSIQSLFCFSKNWSVTISNDQNKGKRLLEQASIPQAIPKHGFTV